MESEFNRGTVEINTVLIGLVPLVVFELETSILACHNAI